MGMMNLTTERNSGVDRAARRRVPAELSRWSAERALGVVGRESAGRDEPGVEAGADCVPGADCLPGVGAGPGVLAPRWLGGWALRAGVLHEWLGLAPGAWAEGPAGGDLDQPQAERGKHAQAEPMTPGRAAGGRGRAAGQDAGPWLPALSLMMDLARLALLQAHERQSESAHARVVWIGRQVWPYVPAMAAMPALDGAEPNEGGVDLLGRSLWVDAEGMNDRIWAAERSLRCRDVVMVIADGRGFNKAATRRLQLLTHQAGCTLLLARPWQEYREISHAAARWMVYPVARPVPGWGVMLLRSRAGAVVGVAQPQAE